jgi:hypothetical protein
VICDALRTEIVGAVAVLRESQLTFKGEMTPLGHGVHSANLRDDVLTRPYFHYSEISNKSYQNISS